MSYDFDRNATSPSDAIGLFIDGRYLIEREIGRGGMGIVYQAFDQRLTRPCAVKRLLPHLQADPRVRQRFIDEAQRMANIDDPGIVRIYDFGTAPDFGSYFVMDLSVGGSLADYRARRGPLLLERVLEIGTAIAKALAAVHEAGIVHRDVNHRTS